MADQNRAWNFPIQWSRAFGEEIRFRTEIITSRRGVEQRIAQRANPRISYDFESFLNFKDFREALLRLNENQGRPIHFPHPRYATTTTTANSVTTDTSKAVCFTIDDSGSMANNGKLATMKTAMTTVLATLRDRLQNGSISRLDINVTKWSDTSTGVTHYNATPAQVNALIAFVNGFSATGTATNFDLAAQNAVAFMNDTLATTLGRRVWVFISDGQPFPAGSDDTAAATAADLIDRANGSFNTAAGTAVDVVAINIQDTNVAAARKLDNTPGDDVPVVAAVDPQALLDYVLAATDGVSIGLQAAQPWIRRGDKLFLEQDGKREMLTVAQVNGSTITSIESLDNVFTPGAIVRRGVSGYVDGDSELRAATSRVGLSRIEIDADPVDTWHPDYSNVPQLLNGKEYFVFGPQWGTDVQVKWSQPVIELDLQRGDVDRVFPTPYTTRQTKLRFLLRNDDHIDRLVGLFYRCRGRQKSFYMEQHLDEIRPRTIVPGSTFTVPGGDFARRYSNNNMYRFIRLRTATLDLTTNIVQVTINLVGDSVVTIGDVFSTVIEPQDIKSMKWVCLCRFESDSLNLEWITDGVAETTVTIRTLEDPV